MKRILFFFVLLFSVLAFSQEGRPLKNSTSTASFQKNKGQIFDQNGAANPTVLYLLNTPGINVQLKKNGFSYDVYEREKKAASAKTDLQYNNLQKIKESNLVSEKIKTLYHRIDFEFVNANPDVVIIEKEETKTVSNYYNIPGLNDGITGITGAKKIIYKSLYTNIDLEFFIPEDPAKPVEYNFLIHPGGNLEDIQMKISGADFNCTSVGLEFDLAHGKLTETIPASWLEEGEKKIPVSIEYRYIGEGLFGFFDPEETSKNKNSILTIDPTPVREWATYFGGEGDESYFVGDVVSDDDGFSTMIGYTTSNANLATSNSHQSHMHSSHSGYMARFDPNGTLLWSTYYGGSLGAVFRSLSLDPAKNIIAVGDSASPDNVATPGSFQTSLNDSEANEHHGDGLIVKFNTNGERLWGTYFGGESFDGLIDVTTDAIGNIYTVGSTSSHNHISTPGSFKEIGDAQVHGHWNGILAKFDPNGNRIWASFYSGEEINQIAVDSRGDIYFTGSTYSFEGIATPGAYQENLEYEYLQWSDAFLVKFNSGGERIWGTYYGGPDYEFGHGLVIDSRDNVIISGQTRSRSNIATPGAHQEDIGGGFMDWDAYLAKFTSGGQILWSTFYGGTESESWGFTKVDVDANDNIYLFGNTNSENNISTPGSFQEEKAESADVFLTKFTADGLREWGTYYGGNSSEYSLALDVNVKGEIFLVGWTYSSSGIATPGSHQVTYGGNEDEFLVKMNDCLSSITVVAPTGICEGEDLEFTASGGISYLWSGPNGFSSTNPNPLIPTAGPQHAGEYSVMVSSGNDCNDTRTFEVFVTAAPVANPVSSVTACEDEYSSGLSTALDVSTVEDQVLNGQTGMLLSYFDAEGNTLPGPLPNPMANTTAGRQTITLRVANENNPGCYAETTFDLIVHSLPPANNMDDLYVCDDDNDGYTSFDLSGIEQQITGNEPGVKIEFVNGNGEIILQPLPEDYVNRLKDEEKISARIFYSDSNCSREIEFNLVVRPAPVAYALQDIIGCDDNGDGISEYFDVSRIRIDVLKEQTGLEVNYFRSDGSEIFNFSSPYTNLQPNEEIVIVKVTDPLSKCFMETNLKLRTSEKPEINSPEIFYGCNGNSGNGSFDTSTWIEKITGNQPGLKVIFTTETGNVLPTPLPEMYFPPLSEKITARVENELNPNCFTETVFDLGVITLPPLPWGEVEYLCPFSEYGGRGYVENAYIFDEWEWKFGDEVISTTSFARYYEAGNYSLTVSTTVDGVRCEDKYFFSVVRRENPIITAVNYRELSDQNYIEIIATSNTGPLEYSIDGYNFQDSNYFPNVPGGVYTVWAIDKPTCGEASTTVVLMDYPKFFTPNNDGYNDLWQLKGVKTSAGSAVLIYDRYGKLLKQIPVGGPGWDGTFNGKLMPADDYWFSVILENGENYKSHFSLIR